MLRRITQRDQQTSLDEYHSRRPRRGPRFRCAEDSAGNRRPSLFPHCPRLLGRPDPAARLVPDHRGAGLCAREPCRGAWGQPLEPLLLRRDREQAGRPGLSRRRDHRPARRGLSRGFRRPRSYAHALCAALAAMDHRPSHRALARRPALLPAQHRRRRRLEPGIPHRRRRSACDRAARRLPHRADQRDPRGSCVPRRAVGSGRIDPHRRRRLGARHPGLHGLGGDRLFDDHLARHVLPRPAAHRSGREQEHRRGAAALRAHAGARLLRRTLRSSAATRTSGCGSRRPSAISRRAGSGSSCGRPG